MTTDYLLYQVVKITFIIIIGNINFFLAILSSKFLKTHVIQPYKKTESKLTNFFNIIFIVSCILIAVYLIRAFIKSLPPFLDGLYGFKSANIKELNGSVILAFAFLIYLKDSMEPRIIKLFSDF